ncbi:hypothetical protein EDC01DRAFT_619784 [Geopyxis carbonaria]|nr:hypothetical protein EDC01DRAFT_619784 [Geopyxis carbonaria]
MCIRITERYAVCKCLYFTHGVDPCQSVAQHGHPVQDKTVLVGYACSAHTPAGAPGAMPHIGGVIPESYGGYGSYR